MSKKNKTKSLRLWRHWHKQCGVFSALVLIFLSVSGIALNHTESIDLAKVKIESTWWLDHYGVKKPHQVRAFDEGNIIVADTYIWLNEKTVIEVESNVLAAYYDQAYFWVYTPNELNIYTPEGELADQINALSGLPQHISHVSKQGDYIIVKNSQGTYIAHSQVLEWEAYEKGIQPIWIKEYTLTPHKVEAAGSLYRSQFLSLERIIVDAHSGRIFGLIGILFMDFIALLLILLSCSGLYIWLRQRK